MHLYIYYRLLTRYLRTFVLVLSGTVVLVLVLTLVQPPVYRSSATWIIGPGEGYEDTRSVASGLDILSREAQIARTYTEIASSDLIKQQVAAKMSIPENDIDNFLVESELLAGTNVIRIAVEGYSADLVVDFANTVGHQTAEFAADLYGSNVPYVLIPLDIAKPPARAVSPRVLLNLLIGGCVGFILAVGAVLLSAFLEFGLKESAPDSTQSHTAE